MRRYWVYAVLIVLAGVCGYQVYKVNVNRVTLTDQYNAMNSQASALSAENNKLEQDIQYYSDPHNLEKELRARFNYRLPGENMIIVVPKSSAPSTPSTSTP